MAETSSIFNFYQAVEGPGATNRFWFTRLLLALLGLLLATLITDFGIVLFVDDGLTVLKNTYHEEVQYLSNSMDAQAQTFVSEWVNTAYHWIFVKSGVHHYLYSGGGQITNNLLSNLWPLLQGIVIGFQIFMLRLAVIALMLPFMGLIMIVAIADGYLGWFRRRSGGGRESGFIYHRSKNVVGWSLISLWFFYLVPPFAINPVYIFLPSMIILGISTRFSIQYFKKYL